MNSARHLPRSPLLIYRLGIREPFRTSTGISLVTLCRVPSFCTTYCCVARPALERCLFSVAKRWEWEDWRVANRSWKNIDVRACSSYTRSFAEFQLGMLTVYKLKESDVCWRQPLEQNMHCKDFHRLRYFLCSELQRSKIGLNIGDYSSEEHTTQSLANLKKNNSVIAETSVQVNHVSKINRPQHRRNTKTQQT